jgi:MFS superfamily sulfate permease-like transporter
VCFLGIELGLIPAVAMPLLTMMIEAAIPPTAIMGQVPGTTAYRWVGWQPLAALLPASGCSLPLRPARAGTCTASCAGSGPSGLAHHTSCHRPCWPRPLAPNRNIKQYPEAKPVPGILIFRVSAPLYFANLQVGGWPGCPAQQQQQQQQPWCRQHPAHSAPPVP